jgi:hypothetical protein
MSCQSYATANGNMLRNACSETPADDMTDDNVDRSPSQGADTATTTTPIVLCAEA